MSDLDRVQRAAEIIQNESAAPTDRVWEGLEALGGLRLSDLDDSTQRAVEKHLVAINQVTADSGIETEADYDRLTDSDARDILSRIQKVTDLCTASETQRVLQELDAGLDKLPVEAIEAVRRQPAIYVPLLTKSLEQALQRVQSGNAPVGNLHFFAVWLLTELEVTEAYPLLIEVFLDYSAGELLGDGINLMPSVLALILRDRRDELEAIARDPELDLSPRWSAASTYAYLVRDEVISRQEAVDTLHQMFQDFVRDEDYEMLGPLAIELCGLAADTALESLQAAFERDLVDDFLVDLDSVARGIAAGEKTVEKHLRHCRPSGIPDTIAELEEWTCFQERSPASEREPVHSPSTPTPPPEEKAESLAPDTFVRTEPRVGRNDPCPCGSGKKSKKCCR